MTKDFDHLLWAYRAVFTQAGAGGGSVKVTFTMNERTVFLYGAAGPDDYAADRTVRGYLTDSAGNHLNHVLYGTPADNEPMNLFIPSRATAVVASTTSDYSQRVVIGKGDKLILDAVSLVQNEELTIILRALFKSWPPTVTTTGSGGTVTVVTTYNKVI